MSVSTLFEEDAFTQYLEAVEQAKKQYSKATFSEAENRRLVKEAIEKARVKYLIR